MRSLYLLALSEEEKFATAVNAAIKTFSYISLQSSSSFRTALPRIRVERFDCIIIDKNLGNGDGITLAPIINRVNPDCLIILVVQESQWATLEAARALGFSAIMSADLLEQDLALVLSEKLLQRRDVQPEGAISARHKLERLTDREREILVDLSQGKRNYEIARSRHISEGTIKSHLTSIYRKLEVRNRVEAISMMNSY